MGTPIWPVFFVDVSSILVKPWNKRKTQCKGRTHFVANVYISAHLPKETWSSPNLSSFHSPLDLYKMVSANLVRVQYPWNQDKTSFVLWQHPNRSRWFQMRVSDGSWYIWTSFGHICPIFPHTVCNNVFSPNKSIHIPADLHISPWRPCGWGSGTTWYSACRTLN